MRRIAVAERPRWRELAERLGFHFHTLDGAPYWDETAYYRFTLEQIEHDLEAPTEELHAMAMDLVDRAVRDEEYLRRLAIPPAYWEFIRRSWLDGQPPLYGRMDFAYHGSGPAKLYELNYDTPTSLYEAAFFQWLWLEQSIAQGTLAHDADQFNSIQEALIGAFAWLGAAPLPQPLYFASVRDSIEDRGTVEYLRDCAVQAGLATDFIAVEDIGASADGRFTDLEERVIPALFKLYPWEHLFREAFGPLLPACGTVFFEPPWKALLSNKGALPLLWSLHPGHPNLLPAFFDDGSADLPPGWVRKPLFSREGANVTLRTGTGELIAEDGPYADAPFIRQAFAPLPCFDGNYAVVGSWVVADRACGIGIREDRTLITKDTSRFLPHVIL